MANITGGQIVWRLDADATSFNAAITAAEKKAKDFQASLSKIDTSVASVFKSVNKSVLTGSQSFTNFGNSAKNRSRVINGSISSISDTITALSRNTNLSTGALTSMFIRTNNSGRLLAQDGLALMNNGIKIISAVSKQLGVDLQGAERAIASGTVTSKIFSAALQDIARNQRTYVNATENAQSLTGRFRDTLLGVFAGNIVTSALTTLSSRVTNLGKSIADTGLNFEQFRISFDTMLGSTSKAESLLKNIGDFAAQTPFDLPQVVEGAKRLLAYNIEAEKILPTFEALGNIAAGVGKDKLPQLILAFGQVRAATFLTGAELRQFTEAGVPLLDVLAKQSGKTAAQIKSDMESGARIPFEEVEKALFGMSKEGGKFFNLMRRQSKTLGGTLSNISDNVKRFQLSFLGLSESGEIIEGGAIQYPTPRSTKNT